jgi:DHA2 family methylenomycin A resistance protein-like MFS transporter
MSTATDNRLAPRTTAHQAATQSPTADGHTTQRHTTQRHTTQRHAAGSRPAVRRAGPNSVLFTAIFGFFVIGLDASVVNVALPSIGHALSGQMSGLQWVVDAYTLMFAALLLSAGSMSDRIGAHRAYGIGLAVFVLASAACGLAPNLGVLVGARIVQGGAAALVLPASLALIRQAFDEPARRARAIALWTVAGAVSFTAGPVVGGVLTSTASWRLIFFVNLPIGAVALALLTRIAPSARRPAPLDLTGQATAVVALGALTYGMIEGGQRGFTSTTTLVSVLIFVLAGAAFLLVEHRRAEPMVPLSLFRSATVSVCVVIGFVVNVVFYGLVFVFGLYFQQILGYSALLAGLMFVPATTCVAFTNVASAKAAARFGPRLPILAGQLISGAGLIGLLLAVGHTPSYVLVLLLVPMCVGLGFAVPSLTAALLESVPGERAGMAAGVLNSSRQVGGALAVAVFGALISHHDTFRTGLRESITASVVLLAAASLLALVGLRRRAANVLVTEG